MTTLVSFPGRGATASHPQEAGNAQTMRASDAVQGPVAWSLHVAVAAHTLPGRAAGGDQERPTSSIGYARR